MESQTVEVYQIYHYYFIKIENVQKQYPSAGINFPKPISLWRNRGTINDVAEWLLHNQKLHVFTTPAIDPSITCL